MSPVAYPFLVAIALIDANGLRHTYRAIRSSGFARMDEATTGLAWIVAGLAVAVAFLIVKQAV